MSADPVLRQLRKVAVQGSHVAHHGLLRGITIVFCSQGWSYRIPGITSRKHTTPVAIQRLRYDRVGACLAKADTISRTMSAERQDSNSKRDAGLVRRGDSG